MVATGLFTKSVVGKALSEQNALAVAKFISYDVFLTYSMPFKILSDPDAPFVNQLVKELYQLLDVKRVTTSGFRPQCNGSSERYNQTLAHMLSKFVDEQQKKVR